MSSFSLLGGCTTSSSFSTSKIFLIYSTDDSVGDFRDQIKRVGGDELVSRCKPLWGFDSEGEINGVWRDLGVPNMWYMMG